MKLILLTLISVLDKVPQKETLTTLMQRKLSIMMMMRMKLKNWKCNHKLARKQAQQLIWLMLVCGLLRLTMKFALCLPGRDLLLCHEFKEVARSGTKTKGNARKLTKNWFYRDLRNGEKGLRTWMVYSPSKETLFCFCCRLFSTGLSSLSADEGFRNLVEIKSKSKWSQYIACSDVPRVEGARDPTCWRKGNW